MTFTLAIAGKGGIGKTTLAALFVRVLKEAGKGPILAVDADPNSNLAEALGVDPGRPLAEIREQLSGPEGSPPGGMGRARGMDDEIQRAVAEADGFDLITMGRPEGPRCYCAANNLLRASLERLTGNYAVVVMDNEAGMEHLSRRTTNNVDALVALLNPTEPSLRAVRRILALSHELPLKIARRMVLLNRVGPQGSPQGIERELAVWEDDRLPDVPQDDEIERAGAAGEDVFHLRAGSPALAAAGRVVDTLIKRS